MESLSEWNYHDEEILMSSDLTQKLGGYKATAIKSNARDKRRKCEVKCKQKDRQVLRTKLNKRLLFTVSSQAASHKWNGHFEITGYTCVSKLDATTNRQCLYCAHLDYNGEEWSD